MGVLTGLPDWLIPHHHDGGATPYLVTHPVEPAEEEVINHVLEEEFEPDKGEWIDIISAPDVVNLTKKLGQG